MQYFRSVISSPVLLLVLVALIIMLFSQEYIRPKAGEGVSVQVLWPLPEANLTATQVFSVKIPDLTPAQLARYKMVWELEDGTLSGPMEFDGIDSFVVSVDTNKWDWKRDNQYKLTFLVKDNKEEIRRREEMMVFVNNTGLPSVALDEPISEIVPDPATNSASVVEAVTPKLKPAEEVEVKVTTPTPVTPTFVVDLVKAPAKQDQKFVIKFSGYDNAETGVFWKVDDGNKNPIYNDGKGFVASVNIYGWRWRGDGPYPVTIGLLNVNTGKVLVSKEFIFSRKGESEVAVVVSETKVLASSDNIKVDAKVVSNSATSASSTTPKPTPVATTVEDKLPALLTTTLKPLKVGSLYVPKKPAIESALADSQNSNEKEALAHIMKYSTAIWLNGDGIDNNLYVQNVITDAKAKSQLPVFVLYNIPDRDCGSHSSGGAKASNDYRAWVDRLANHLTGEAIVVVEPDAIAMLNCLSAERQTERLALIKYAVDKLSNTNPNLHLYLDAGHAYWVNAEEMSSRLKRAGIASARGFALNVSNFVGTKENNTYGQYLSNLLGGKHFIIDTSRNGRGPSANREWCNPKDRGLGEDPAIFAGTKGNLDAYLWVKIPGESDGTCNGGPHPGGWWTAYAAELYRNRI